MIEDAKLEAWPRAVTLPPGKYLQVHLAGNGNVVIDIIQEDGRTFDELTFGTSRQHCSTRQILPFLHDWNDDPMWKELEKLASGWDRA